jgi:hypothetical protein
LRHFQRVLAGNLKKWVETVLSYLARSLHRFLIQQAVLSARWHTEEDLPLEE